MEPFDLCKSNLCKTENHRIKTDWFRDVHGLLQIFSGLICLPSHVKYIGVPFISSRQTHSFPCLASQFDAPQRVIEGFRLTLVELKRTKPSVGMSLPVGVMKLLQF